jgi:hypothetical protein
MNLWPLFLVFKGVFGNCSPCLVLKPHLERPYHICSLRIAKSAARPPDLAIRREQKGGVAVISAYLRL